MCEVALYSRFLMGEVPLYLSREQEREDVRGEHRQREQRLRQVWRQVIDSGLLGSTDSQDLSKGYRESRRCSRGTCSASYITRYTSIHREKRGRARKASSARAAPAV